MPVFTLNGRVYDVATIAQHYEAASSVTRTAAGTLATSRGVDTRPLLVLTVNTDILTAEDAQELIAALEAPGGVIVAGEAVDPDGGSMWCHVRKISDTIELLPDWWTVGCELVAV